MKKIIKLLPLSGAARVDKIEDMMNNKLQEKKNELFRKKI
jgi:hypothetical protein